MYKLFHTTTSFSHIQRTILAQREYHAFSAASNFFEDCVDMLK